jgi:ACS family glucarate transporter-like MFS transporter
MIRAHFSIRWLLIFWVFIVGAITYFDRVNISVVGGDIARDFHLSNVQLGWVFSAFVAGYALFQAPAGWLADRYGARLMLTLGIVWWSVFASAITVISPRIALPVVALIAVRFVLGMGEALVYPASNCIVAAWIPSSERGFANGLIFSGVGFGAGIAPPLVTYFLFNYGWRMSFWAGSAFGLVAALVWYFSARDLPSQHPRITCAELAVIASGTALYELGVDRTPKLGWREILRNRNLLALTFSYFCYGYEAYIFFSWFFIYLHTARGLDLKRSGYYSTLPFLAMAVCSPAGGRISDLIAQTRGLRVGRCYLSAIAIGVSAMFLVIGTRVATAQFASVVLAGGAGALYLSQSCYWSMSADIGKRSAGSVSGLMNMGGQIGGALTASITPWIADRFGWTASFLVAAGLSAAGAVAWLFIKPEEKFQIGALSSPSNRPPRQSILGHPSDS